MKKNKLIKFAGVMVILAALVFSCTPPVVEEPAGELDAIKDVSYTGSTVSSKAEAIDTTVYAMQTLSSVLGSAAIPANPSQTMGVFSKSLSKAPGEMPFEGLPEFLGAGFNGTVRYSNNNTVNGQDGSSATMSNSVALTASHDLPLTAQPVIDIMNMDGNPNTMDTKLPQTLYTYLITDTPTFPYGLANGNTISAMANLQSNATVTNAHGTVLVDTTTVNLTINKATLNVSMGLNANATDIGVRLTSSDNIKANAVPEVTSGTLGLASNYNISLLMVVSSDSDTVKGGKLQITATYSKNINNINIVNLYTNFTEQNITAMMETLFGSLDTISVTVKVYDNGNNKVLEETMTLAELLAKLQA